MQDNRAKNILQLHFIVFLFGFTSVLGALISISAIKLTIFRMGIAVLFLALFIFFYDKKKNNIKKSFNKKSFYLRADNCASLDNFFLCY